MAMAIRRIPTATALLMATRHAAIPVMAIATAIPSRATATPTTVTPSRATAIQTTGMLIVRTTAAGRGATTATVWSGIHGAAETQVSGERLRVRAAHALPRGH